jgi:hypothetical protein
MICTIRAHNLRTQSELPDPKFLAIHAACCKLMQMSAVADYVEDLLDNVRTLLRRVGARRMGRFIDADNKTFYCKSSIIAAPYAASGVNATDSSSSKLTIRWETAVDESNDNSTFICHSNHHDDNDV